MFLPAQHELLLQIIERPDDDQLRFVLADRLIEAGDPLGELIHVQCALERMSRGEGAGDWLALERREAELLREHGATWHQAAAPFANSMVMKRGLPHLLRCKANTLLEDGGLTVLAPIVELELQYPDAEDLEALLRLPLLRRIRSLSLADLRGLTRLRRTPPPLPANVKRLKIAVDGALALERLVDFGLLEPVEELELGIRFLVPQPLQPLEPPALPGLRHLSFFGNPGHQDEDWLPFVQELSAARPALVIGWHGIDYDASNLRSALRPQEPQFLDDPVARPADAYNREPFGELGAGEAVGRRWPLSLDVHRLGSGALVASASLRPTQRVELQSLSLDAALQLQLPPLPGVLTALSFTVELERMHLRYEAWASRALSELGLPVPRDVAVEVVAQLAPAMLGLRAGLRKVGVAGWPRALGLDDVLLGTDGGVKLLPAFMNCLLDDSVAGAQTGSDGLLGQAVDDDLEGTDDGVLILLGGALMHLLAGASVSRRLRPSALDAAWRPLDPLVEGCLSRRRASRFATVEAFIDAMNQVRGNASKDAVARLVVSKQISPT